jgi:ABC-type Fe3+ transport system permease subunit
MQQWRMAVVLMAVCSVLVLAAGCASHQRQATTIEEETSSERPARPLSEEESLADRAGEIGVVLLVVLVTVGGILVPILLLK